MSAASQQVIAVLLKIITTLQSLFLVLVWFTLTFVEDDIKHDVNWFIMIKNHLTVEYDFYSYIKSSNLLVCIIYLIMVTTGCHSHQVLTGLAFTMNTVMLYLLQTTAYKIWQLFLVSLPLVAVRCTTTHLYTILVIILLLILVYSCRRVLWVKPTHTVTIKELSLPLAINMVALVIVISVQVLTVAACRSCSIGHALPTMPLLTAHRGCPSADYPENSDKAFENVSSLKSVVTLESDVHISMDGVPFLLHDPNLARTTSIMQSCPKHNQFSDASSYHYYSTSPCGLQSLHLKGYEDLSILTLAELLKIAKEFEKNVIFDLQQPPPGHPHAERFINLTLEEVKKSKISLDKLWWLCPMNRSIIHSQYPDMTLVGKTVDTGLEDFERLNIKIANEEWSTPIHVIRELQGLGVSINMYTISTKPLFDYAWCLGVETITTNDCQRFSVPQENLLFNYCRHSCWRHVGHYILIFLVCLPIVRILYNYFH